MLALGLLLNFAGIGLFCWLIFTLAVYALPFFVGLHVFMLALHGGAGILGAPLVGIAAGGMTFAIGQTAFAMTRSVDHPCHHCRPVCGSGDTCWLSGRVCDVANRRAVIGLARDLRLSRRGLYWRHGVDAVDHLHREPARSIRTGQSGAILNRFSQPQRISNDPAPSVGRTCQQKRRTERGSTSLSER